jgi:RNA polymerase subunit RPABC4/transcription elongation factor Spt4
LEIEALIARGLQILIALGGAYFVALWFVLVVWTFRDIESRSRSVVTQVLSTLLVILFWIPGMALYWVLRPKETLDEAYQRSLEEEYLLQDLEELPLCPTCQHYVEDDFQLCPHCHTQLKDHCHNCERLVDLRWALCPYCGEPQHHHHEHPEHEKVSSPDERWVDPAAIEKRLREAEERRVREETRALPAATATAQSVRDLLGIPLRRMNPVQPEANGSVAPPAERDATAETVAHQESDQIIGPVPPEGASSNTAAADPVDSKDTEESASPGDGGTPGEAIDQDRQPDDGTVKSNGNPGPTKVPKSFKVN